MNKQGLIDALKVKYYAVNDAEIQEGKTEADITVWGIGVFNKEGEVIKKLNLTFYTEGKEDTSPAFWGVSEPKPTPSTPPPTFTERVEGAIIAKVTDGTIKFAYITQTNETVKKALLTAIMPDKSEKKVLATESTPGDFTLEVL